jgi:hypothetical protein
LPGVKSNSANVAEKYSLSSANAFAKLHYCSDRQNATLISFLHLHFAAAGLFGIFA